MAIAGNVIRGRGTAENPSNRFEKVHAESELEGQEPNEDDDAQSPSTQFIEDKSATIIAYNDSPDVGFSASINPYRGCEHGCIYCYARPTHEYLGFSSGLDFETKIMFKERAPELLRNELMSPRWQPQVIAMSGVTDCYQPVERVKRITRRCLEVLAEFRNPVGIITKNHLVARDADVLADLAQHNAALVMISLTTLDLELKKKLEPRTSQPEARLAAISKLAQAGVPVGVMIAPIIPAINDHEIPALLKAAAQAGAKFAGRTLGRLPYSVAPLFEDWLHQHFPDRKEKVLNQIRAYRDGKINESQFGSRMRGEGRAAKELSSLFGVACRKAGIAGRFPELSTAAFRRPGEQLKLF